MRYTPEVITELNRNEIFVYGSNQYARHTAGSAKVAAEKFGAVMDTAPMGLVGQSYGIITISYNDQSVTTGLIGDQVMLLYKFALLRRELTFYVTKIGTGIAGFSIEQIAEIFRAYEFIRPENVILPIEFSNPQ